MKLLPAIAISAAAFSSAACAADLPTRKEPPPPAPVIQPFSWSGIYVGGYVGGAIGTANMLDLDFPNFPNGNLFDPVGFTGGGLVGANYQFNSFVIGAEGEFGYDGVRKSKPSGTAVTILITNCLRVPGSLAPEAGSVMRSIIF